MQINTRRCMQCKGEMAMTALGPTTGEEQGVRMTIAGMPAMQCAEGHKRFIAPEFAVRMMETFVAGEPLAALEPAAEKGLLRKRLHCPGCGAELAGPPAAQVRAERTVALKGLEAFAVKVEMPKYRCAGCGKESLPPGKTLNDGLMKASVQAFRAAQVTPT
jgi:DNA-directed RNA polymerase subunit RPC12/RpoP